MRPVRHTRFAHVLVAAGFTAFLAPPAAQAGVLFAEGATYSVTVPQPGSDFTISFNNAQTTVFTPDMPFVIEAGAGNVETVVLHTGARFDAKPGFILTGLTVSAGANAEAWEGGYSVGGTWVALNPGIPADATGSFGPVGNVTYNQNASIEFPGVNVGLQSPTLFFSADLVLRVAGSAPDCGRTVCARIGDPHVRVDVQWTAVPIPEPETWALMTAGVMLVGGAALRRPRR